jgi:hypothetical protein
LIWAGPDGPIDLPFAPRQYDHFLVILADDRRQRDFRFVAAVV